VIIPGWGECVDTVALVTAKASGPYKTAALLTPKGFLPEEVVKETEGNQLENGCEMQTVLMAHITQNLLTPFLVSESKLPYST